LDVCLHDTAGCQTGCTPGLTTGCTAGLTTGCIHDTSVFSNRLSNGFDIRLNVCIRDTRLLNGFDNRFDNRFHRVNGA